MTHEPLAEEKQEPAGGQHEEGDEHRQQQPADRGVERLGSALPPASCDGVPGIRTSVEAAPSGHRDAQVELLARPRGGDVLDRQVRFSSSAIDE